MKHSRVRGNLKRAIATLITRNTAVILGYHGVSDGPLTFQNWIQIPKNLFAEHIEYLSRNYRCVSLSDLLDTISQKKSLRNTVSITFDDGYANVYRNAFPYLVRHGIPATIFVPPAFVNTTNLLWHDRVSRLIALSRNNKFEFMGTTFSLSCTDELAVAYRKVVNWCKSLHPNKVVALITDLLGQLNIKHGSLEADNDRDEFRILNSSEIAEMEKTGLIEFASHSNKHSSLSTLTIQEAKEELAASKQALEQIPGSVPIFSYPNGTVSDFNDFHKSCLKQLGFKAGLTSISCRTSSSSDLYALPRIMIGDNCNLSSFKNLIVGANFIDDVLRALDRMLGSTNSDNLPYGPIKK